MIASPDIPAVLTCSHAVRLLLPDMKLAIVGGTLPSVLLPLVRDLQAHDEPRTGGKDSASGRKRGQGFANFLT